LFGKVYGTVFAIFQVGAILGINLLGLIRQHSGSYATGLWILAALCAALIALFARFKPYGAPVVAPNRLI